MNTLISKKSGYQIDHKPVIERYVGYMIINDRCEICVPIRQKA